jgi:hypothetical protein
MTAQPASVMAAGKSVVSYRIGGREHPMVRNRRCKVCMSPYRFQIEENLVEGRTYGKIITHLPEDHELSTRNIKDHYLNGHMPMEVSATRQVVEAQARRVGKSIENHADSLVDGITLAHTVIQKTFESIAKGETIPTPRDGLRAMKVLSDLGEYDSAGGMDMDAMVEAFVIYMDNAEAHMTPEQFEDFHRALDTNPVLKALERRYQEQQEGHPVQGEAEEKEGEDSSLA